MATSSNLDQNCHYQSTQPYGKVVSGPFPPFCAFCSATPYVPPSAHPLTGPRCLSPSHQFSPPGLGISADESQNRETRGHETSLSVPSNAARKQRKISANQIPEVPAPHNEPSSGSLEASPSSAPSRQVSSSSTPYADPSTYLSTTRSAIRASRWLQQQIVEPTIGSSADTISQGRGICGQSIYTLLFDEDLLCFECGKHQDKRTRAITHQRVHFNHKPFRCEGDCGRKSCRVRFACRDAKQGHCTRTKEKKTKCDSCDLWIIPRNLKRHILNAHQNQINQDTNENIRKDIPASATDEISVGLEDSRMAYDIVKP